MEARVLELAIKAKRKELEEQWKALRRGWYVGTPEFGEDLEKHNWIKPAADAARNRIAARRGRRTTKLLPKP